jgi:uncharacterized YigZ family protein
MEIDEYRTLNGESRGLYKEKGSKFISIALPVVSLDEIKTGLERYRKEFHDARHHCYAYRIGEPPFETRFNDDGEPSGTAGKPILGQIQSYDLTNALIIVVRYFGGVKLGTGGLIQAYKAAAKDAVDNGIIIMNTWKIRLEIQFDYIKMNEVMRIIKEDNLGIISNDTAGKNRIVLVIRKRLTESSLKKFSAVESLEWRVI